MLYRRSASLVEAVRLDGTEAAFAAVLAIPRTAPAARTDGVEITTSCGRRVARTGCWVTRDVVTRAVRLYDDADFQARHEAVH